MRSSSPSHYRRCHVWAFLISVLILVLAAANLSYAQRLPRASDLDVPLPAYAQKVIIHRALAMHGDAANSEKFRNFTYVNPYAPKGGTLRLGVVGTFDSLNPFNIRSRAPFGLDTGTMSLVYESLMTRSWDEPFTLYPLLAEGFEMPEDRSSITFLLDPRARWQGKFGQTGRRITVDDVVFSFETLRDNGRPNHRTYYRKVSRVVIENGRRVRFEFAPQTDGTYDREMPLIIGLMPILPRQEWRGRTFNEPTWREPLGSGPYRVAKVDQGRAITYERDPQWWAKDLPTTRGLYNFDKINIAYWRDDNVALEAFLAKQFDIRRENDPVRFVQAYEGDAKKKGKLYLGHFLHARPEATAGFVFNLRRPLFRDKALREAAALVLDDGWIAKTFFYNQVVRTRSFFPNSDLAADISAPPQGMERDVLQSLGDKIAPEILTQPIAFPTTDGTAEARRENFRRATTLLRAAGYRWEDGVLMTPQGNRVFFDILLGNPSDERIALSWARSLKVLGIYAEVRTVDSAQYQQRLAAFDYDVILGRWYNSLSPGNEQYVYWGSKSADQAGSRNYAGIQNAAVDTLIDRILKAPKRRNLVTAVRALDRVLLSEYYIVPLFNLGYDPIAYWTDRVMHPEATPLYGAVLETWWATPNARRDQGID